MTSNHWDIRELESLLSDHITPGSKILNYDIKMLTAPGENYGSVMQAVDVEIKEPNETSRTLHLVAKRIPANELLCNMFNIQETCKKELNMYIKIIPALCDFEEECGLKSKINELFAKCYGGRLNLKDSSEFVDKDAVILLENLKLIGYEVGDRLEGFDEEHALLILEDLATFHAVPIAYRIKNSEKFETIIFPTIEGVKIGENIEEDARKMAIEDIISVVKDIEKCKPYFDTIGKAIYKNLNGFSRINQLTSQFSSIAHTDYWVNNTMILKNEKGKPIKNKIVDLQMPSYCSVTRDLLFFLYSSVQPSIMYKNIDRYIKYYYDCFIRCLETFNIETKMFSWDNFLNEIKNNAFMELGHLLVMYKPILTKRGAIDDMANLDLDGMLQTDVTTDYKIRVTDCILSFIDRNWI